MIPTNKEAEEYFKDKPHAIIVGTKAVKSGNKRRPYFMHWFKDSMINGDYQILPLQFGLRREWSTLSAREQELKMEQQQQQNNIPRIKGQVPMREILQASGEENMLHPSREYNGPYGQSIRFTPGDCMKWNCSLCFSLTRFHEPIKYARFFGA